ncbi:nicotinate-nucleotide--dimethylbenzimidazole phosphoribosyltransferase [Streptomyces sp. NPDC056987]|uniref:nicotinate-nucleotide--dimethylbenzimidazole phosphoribosyltransferase n=1 Tax=Streptomyces sp. NPDC056987 TaxID=3345988 RepID=UPI003627AA7A
MTDTGQVPGEGLPENAGMVKQPGVPAPGTYTYLTPSGPATEDEDLLLMPSSQGGWSDPQVVPADPHAAYAVPEGYAADSYATAPQQAYGVPEGYPAPEAYAAPAPEAYPPPEAYAPDPYAAQQEYAAAAQAPVPQQAPLIEQPAPMTEPVSQAQVPPQAPEAYEVPAEQAVPAAPEPAPGHPEPAPEPPAVAEAPAPEAAAPPEQPAPEPAAAQPEEPAAEQQPGAHETGGRDSGSVDLNGVRVPPPAAAPATASAPPRRPLHMGPPVPDPTGGVVRSLADRGPAGAPTQAVRVRPRPQTPPVAPEPPEPQTPAAEAVAPEPAPQEPRPEPAAETPAPEPAPQEPQPEPQPEPAPVAAAQTPPAQEIPAPEPEPVAAAAAEPPAPEPVAAEAPAPPAPAPEPEPEPQAAPEPVAETPEPHPEPQPTPEPVAEQTPEPTPAPAAEPEPAPEPEPVAAEAPEPAPEPAPQPEPAPEPATAAAPAPEPAPVAEPDPQPVPAAAAPATSTPEPAPTPDQAPAADRTPRPAPDEAQDQAPLPAEDETAAEDQPAAEVQSPAEDKPTAQDQTAAEVPTATQEQPTAQEEPTAQEQQAPLPAPEPEPEPEPQEGTPAASGYDDAERDAVLRVMRERRDIRNGFRSDPIPHEVLLRVLEAAHTAPSVGHSQPWDFVVIRSAETRRSMLELAQRQRDAYAKSLPKGRAKQFKELKIEAILDTPVNIVVTADPTRGGRHTLGRHTQPQMAPYSSALAVENLWLAARAEGLGVGWVSFFDEREMVRALGLPEHLEVVAYLCVGYVDEFPEEPELMQAGWSKRRPLSWVVHEETYGRRALPGEEPHDLLQETITAIRPLDAKALGEAWERQKRMTKPAGALGMLEIISAQLSGLSRLCPPPIPEPAAVAIFAGDHGVHAQGVTPWPQEVTGQMVANFLAGGAVCNAFATQVGAEVCVVDVGVASDLPTSSGLLPRKVRAGTGDFTTGPALSREEVLAAIEVGIETARDLVAAGNKALLTGEMGIANTTVSAALICVYTGQDPAEVTGRGTGINDEMHARKVDVVRRGLDLHQPDPADPIGVLAAVGGLEHAALVGFLLGGASMRTPVILDGVSAGAAALVARAIAPEALAACIAGHRSAEPGHVAALNKLGLRPLVDLDLRLGEGTGALLALPVIQSAARAMHEVATFDSAGVTEK